MTESYSPTPTDGYATETSSVQAQTERQIHAHRPQSGSAAPLLQKNNHLQFLIRNLVQGFPARYVSQDASQPWLIYWTLHAFSLFGVGLDDKTRRRSIDTLIALQHPNGGFGGGPGQAAHLLPTYAAVSALAIAGRPGEGGGWDSIDRKKMYDFFMTLKQPDGSFLVSQHAEVDVRGIYCLLCVATLLNLLTPALLAGLPAFLATLQTYEGGFGNASFPDWAFPPAGDADPAAPRPPLGEAHGGYTFCATASWLMLQPYIARCCVPAPTIDAHGLLRWCTQMQGVPIELGGFRGRTNKLVDGCYSWWVGGCVVLVETLLGIGAHHAPPEVEGEAGPEEAKEDSAQTWDDIDDSLFDRAALQEYVLYAGQHPAGGLRDKPPKPADSYHTLYCVAGLSAAQHRVVPHDARRQELEAIWDADAARAKHDSSAANPSPDETFEGVRKATFLHVLSWAEDEGTEHYVGGSVNRVNATHPIFNLTITHSDAIMAHFYGQSLPQRRPLSRPARAAGK